MKPVDPASLLAAPAEEAACSVLAMTEARGRQAERAARFGYPRPWNARIPPGLVRTATAPTAEAVDHLTCLARRLGLTGRGLHRTLRVARTAADLAGLERVEARHVGEALQYRGEDAAGA